MDLGLSRKTVVVTGGASNIGRCIVLSFATEGSNVVIVDIDEKQGKKVEAEANALGGAGRTIMLKTDATRYADVQEMVAKVLNQFQQIDILVNNLGWDELRLFVDTDPAFWDKMISLNYVSMLNCCRAVIPAMIERKSGNIVSIASVAGRVGEYMETIYSGCKGATIAVSKSIAREVARYGIRANVVCPTITIPSNHEVMSQFSMWQSASWTEEEQEKIKKRYPLHRLGKAEDTTNAVLFLSSDKASFITGQTLSVDGGYTMV